MSGSKCDLDKTNIITATMEELTEEERQRYLIAEEHFKAQFLKGFKKDRGGFVKRVEDFVMPSFKLTNDKIEEIPEVTGESSSSDFMQQVTRMMDEKLNAAQTATTELLVSMVSSLDKGKNTVETDPNTSGLPENIIDPNLDMPANYYSRQSLHPGSVHEPVRPVYTTGQTGLATLVGQTGFMGVGATNAMVLANSSASGSVFTPPVTTVVGSSPNGSGTSSRPIPNASQNSTLSTSRYMNSASYQADFSKFKEDLANAIKTKLGIDLSNSRLYQKPYPIEFDFVPYLNGWRVPEFVKFNGEDYRTTWEHVSQYILQLGEAGFQEPLRIRLFSLTLTGTAFSWFSSLAPNSIQTWTQLEHKFHDHFFSGENEAKLTDLTSIRQGREESAMDYF